MKAKLFIALLLTLPVVCSGSGFISIQLKSIFDSISRYTINETRLLDGDSSRFSNSILTDIKIDDKNFAIITGKDYYDNISHIGLHLFNRNHDGIPYEIHNFIERYLLLVILNEPQFNKDIVQVSLQVNSLIVDNFDQMADHIFRMVSNPFDFSLTFDNADYSFQMFGSNKDEINIIFPADYELITGMDKQESSLYLYHMLNSGSHNNSHLFYEKGITHTVSTNSNFLVLSSDSLSENISNKLHYLIRDKDTLLVLSPDLPEIYTRNSLLLPESLDYNIFLNVSQVLYRQEKREYNTTLGNFYSILGPYYKRFVGIESLGEKISASVFTVNRFLKILNVLYLSFDVKDIEMHSDLTCQSKLYGPIRYDNIENLFSEYPENFKIKYKIKTDYD
ncbi:MAG: hypothetical protein JW995_15685 [Melioribacteraceae bacterium]|nr:hypothetical protein [Melioribacteraceae bacterium]